MSGEYSLAADVFWAASLHVNQEKRDLVFESALNRLFNTKTLAELPDNDSLEFHIKTESDTWVNVIVLWSLELYLIQYRERVDTFIDKLNKTSNDGVEITAFHYVMHF